MTRFSSTRRFVFRPLHQNVRRTECQTRPIARPQVFVYSAPRSAASYEPTFPSRIDARFLRTLVLRLGYTLKQEHRPRDPACSLNLSISRSVDSLWLACAVLQLRTGTQLITYRGVSPRLLDISNRPVDYKGLGNCPSIPAGLQSPLSAHHGGED